MKFWLSIVLIMAIFGLVAYIVILEAGRTESADGRLNENEISETVKTATALRKAGQAQEAIKVLKKAKSGDTIRIF